MISLKIKIVAFLKCLLYSLLVVLIDIILIFFFSEAGSRFNYNLSFMLLLEGGIGLIIGGAVVLYSPSLSKMSEVFLTINPKRVKSAAAKKAVLILKFNKTIAPIINAPTNPPKRNITSLNVKNSYESENPAARL